MSNISLLTKIPVNTSLLQGTKFTFTFPNLPFLRYFCQSVELPGISTSPVTVSSPFANMYRHGDKLVFGDLTITALIDEDLRLWEETRNWLVALTKPSEYREYLKYLNGEGKPYHDAFLTINNNANIPNIRIKYTYCHPFSLSPISFNTTTNADETITASISFRYDQFEIERMSE